MTLRIAASDIDKSLREIDDLPDNMRVKVLRKLHRNGHIDAPDARLLAAAMPTPPSMLSKLPSPLQASQERPEMAMRIKAAIASARRLGADIDPARPIDPYLLSRQIAAAEVDDRMRLKGELHYLGLLPA